MGISIKGINLADVAMEHCSKAIELNPLFVEAYFDRAHVYLLMEDFDKAIDDFNRAIELNPDHAYTYVQRGRTYFDKGCDDRAIDDFRRAIELGDNSVRGHLEAAQIRRSSKGAGEVESVN